jgi:acyl-coenzyme A synthetase/AMP-(fatty) acid ligase
MIVERIHGWAQSQPAKVAVVHNDTQISYASFSRAIEDLRVRLEKEGLPAGGVAIVLAGNLLECWTLVMALRALGLTTIAVPSIAEAEQLAIRNVACVVVSERRKDAQDLSGSPLAAAKVVLVPRISYSAGSDDLRHPTRNPIPFGGHIVYSSGTTGTYKKLLLDGANDVEINDWWIRSLSLHGDTVFNIGAFGLWTAAGFGYPPAVWQAGGCVVIDQRKDALQRLASHGVTSTFLPPALLAELVRAHGAKPRLDIELVVSGGFLPFALAEQTIRQLTSSLTIVYASTECIAVLRSHFRRGDDLYWLTPYYERVIQVVDEHGQECPVGSEGDLRILLRNTDASAYLDDEETSARFFRDGFFYPGDMGVKRADGRIRVLGRTGEVLNVGGVKVALAPLEDAIQRHLQVEAVCMFSGLNSKGEDELVVAIQSQAGVPRQKLDSVRAIEGVARVVAAFGGFRFAIMKDFPRTQAGMSKIQRAELRRRLFQ